ncbi:MAG TPA: M4 family metallopeptidase [Holophagaceae bacterium]|nr:M4 family metallopeptidase [Holophagaceae bacterium]
MPRLAQPQLCALKAQEGARTAFAMQKLQGQGASLGLSADTAFQMQRSSTDAFGVLHVHVHQAYKGVPVWGGDAILHTDAENQSLPMTDKLIRGLNVGVAPALEASEALAIASRDMAPQGAFAYTPTSQLVVLPRVQRSLRAGVAAAQANASDVISTVVGADLAWHLRLEVQTQSDTRAMDYLISASNGSVLKKWASIETAGVTGTGNSQYSGTVSLSTNQLSANSYEMRDTLRANTTVTDMANGTSGSGTIFTDADNIWGNGDNYVDGSGMSTTSPTGQTAAVDAQFGFEKTWDYYQNVHGRNGIDGTGKATLLRMHYSSNYNNAFWSDSCFCMTFGDGSAATAGGFNNLTDIDVIGHELSHGVIANSVAGGLNYYDESGGLNEADSDINGTFVTFYGYNGGTGGTVPDTIPGGNLHGYTPWTIGSQISNPPLRFMYKPSKDTASPDAWYFDIGQLDVHYSSGPMTRAMYFLANGAATTGDTSSTYLPAGMAGIGNDKASKIWYRVMTTGLTSSSTYHDARIACENAAGFLYGAAELAAVQNAFAAINVGPAAGGSDDTTPPAGVAASESGTTGTVTLSATATDNVGIERITFSIDGTAMAQMNAAGTAPFDSHMLGNGTHSLIATAYDAYRNHTASSPFSFTTLNSYAQFLIDPGFEQGGVNWGFGGAYAGISTSPTNAHGGSNYAIIGAAGRTGESYGYQIFTLPAGLPGASFALWTRISNTSYPTTSTSDTMEVAVYDSALSAKLQSLQTVSGKDATGNSAATSSWKQLGPFNLSSYGGQTVAIVFDSNCAAGTTSFRVDDVALNTQYAVPDENADTKVDSVDLGLFAKDYGTGAPLSDFNNDGAVDDLDAAVLLNAFGQ